MASSRPWPVDDDDDRPSGSVRPLSQADLQAILAHLGDDPDQLLVGTGGDRPAGLVADPSSRVSPGHHLPAGAGAKAFCCQARSTQLRRGFPRCWHPAATPDRSGALPACCSPGPAACRSACPPPEPGKVA